MWDLITGTSFLINTGADLSVLLATTTTDRRIVGATTLRTANDTIFKTYEKHSLTLSVGLRMWFTWVFTIEKLPFAIMCNEVLKHFDVPVDVERR